MVLPQTIFAHLNGASPDNLLAPQWCSPRQSSRTSIVHPQAIFAHLKGALPDNLSFSAEMVLLHENLSRLNGAHPYNLLAP